MENGKPGGKPTKRPPILWFLPVKKGMIPGSRQPTEKRDFSTCFENWKEFSSYLKPEMEQDETESQQTDV